MIACHLALMLLEVSLIKVTSTFLSLTISPSRHIIFIHIITILFFSNLLIWRYTYRICMPTGNWFLTSVTAVFQPSKLLNKVTRRSYLVWIVIPRKQWIGLPAVLSAPRGGVLSECSESMENSDDATSECPLHPECMGAYHNEKAGLDPSFWCASDGLLHIVYTGRPMLILIDSRL